jgi:cell division protein ZapB
MSEFILEDLENRINSLVQNCQDLREENAQLRKQYLQLEQENLSLRQKQAQARDKVEHVLRQIQAVDAGEENV